MISKDDAIKLTADECAEVIDLLLKDGHGASGYEPECPACTAWKKLETHVRALAGKEQP